MANHWMKKNPIPIVFVIISILLLVLVFVLWKSSSNSKTEIHSLQDKIRISNESITSLKNQLSSKSTELDKKTEELNNINSILKTHFSMSSTIQKDVEELAKTSEGYQSYKGVDYDGNKRYVDEFKSELSLIVSHISKYTKNLDSNKKLFEFLGYDFEKEISTLNKSIILFQIRLLDIAGYTESLKIKNLITDTMKISETKTYTINGVDYEVTLNLVREGEAQFVVNGFTTKIMKDGGMDKLPDNAEIGVVYISETEKSAGFYLGKI